MSEPKVELRGETWLRKGGPIDGNWYRPEDPIGTHVHLPFGDDTALNRDSRLAVALSEVERLTAENDALREGLREALDLSRVGTFREWRAAVERLRALAYSEGGPR